MHSVCVHCRTDLIKSYSAPALFLAMAFGWAPFNYYGVACHKISNVKFIRLSCMLEAQEILYYVECKPTL